MTSTTATRQTLTVCPALILIKGKEEYAEQLQQLTSAAWQIAYTSLWNGTVFSPKEINTAKQRINAFIQSGSPLKAYSELVQRVLMARQYILSHEGSYAPLPSYWFCLENTKGFAGTANWYHALQTARASQPDYKQYLKVLPEAVLQTIQSNTAADFHYWRSWFAERNAQAVLNLFLSVVANCNYDGDGEYRVSHE
jgi:hypothetical protein